MSEYRINDYTFSGLDSLNKPTGGAPFLAYLIGLVDKPDHKISETLPAKRVLSYLYDAEEQAPNAAMLEMDLYDFWRRWFTDGYYPQTPCMVTKAWSPISAMLGGGLKPVILRREEKIRAVATGIWKPMASDTEKDLSACHTVEDLFWAVLYKVSERAKERKMWISLIAEPGWMYDSAIGALPKWSAAEIKKADRVVWQRTPDG